MSRPSPRGRPDEDPAGPRGARPPRRRGPEGDVQVFGSDEQNGSGKPGEPEGHPVELNQWVDLAREALIAEGVDGEAELSLLFVDEETIAGLNLQFMEQTGPTDVLAFPIDEVGPTGRWPDAGSTGPDRDDEPDDLPLLLGDVVLCPAVAARQAAEHGHRVEDEIALLVVHGVLHVLGHDHAEPDEAARMKARERALLEQLYHSRW